MDLALSEEQQMLKETARRFFEKECSKTLVRELLASDDGYSPAHWQSMAELGWLGLPFPERYGGADFRLVDLAVVLEEMGRALLPSPYCATVLLGGYPILEAGSEEQKSSLLPRVAQGELILTMALLETGAAYDPADISLTAKADADGYLLNGVKLFVPYAHIADTILTVVRTAPGEGPEGLSILLVDRATPGVRCTLLRPIDDSKLCEVAFENVRVPKANVLGEPGAAGPAIEKALARAAVAETLLVVGGCQLALELSVEHVKNRVQFGQAVGAFQAVQHHCANISTDIDGSRFLSYQAAWMLSEGLPAAKEVAMAKGWVSDASLRIMSRAHQVHGGVSFITEHDLTLFFKRINAAAVAYGGSNYHYRALAQALGM
ncbi:MAG: acyl-CoA dehydrogenase [Chloroflexota bacterium]|nr:MAG: acyl-CoA dehydrogenase [Chloroflexota bacterium]